MGYELQLSVGAVRTEHYGLSGDTENHDWFQIYAGVDLCKPGHNSEILELKTESEQTDQKPVYFFSPMGDGDTTVIKDRYDAKIYPIPIDVALAALRKDMENDNYRRFNWAIGLLKTMASDTENLHVILWGY